MMQDEVIFTILNAAIRDSTSRDELLLTKRTQTLTQARKINKMMDGTFTPGEFMPSEIEEKFKARIDSLLCLSKRIYYIYL